MADTQNTPAVVRRSTDLVALDELELALLDGKLPAEVEQDPEVVQRNIIEQLLAAESDAELERLEAEGWQSLLGVPFEIHGFVWRPSDYDEGQAIFLVVRATSLVDGSPHVLTTGSGQAMAQLINLAKRGRIPGAIREMCSAETKGKNTVLWLKTPDNIAAAQREAERAAREADAEPATASV